MILTSRLIKVCWILLLVLIYSCADEEGVADAPLSGLEQYLEDNKDKTTSSELIACAASQDSTAADYDEYPISVFFYPIDGATDFRYFESSEIDIDILDFSKFDERMLEDEAVFNGYLRRFKLNTPSQDVWGIVTFRVGEVIHISRAIRMKHYTKPTEFGHDLIAITDSLTYPRFDWMDGRVAENVIYFHVVSNADEDLISGTYTLDRYFQFYDLANVVLNIRDINPPPALDSGQSYQFTLMGVSQDNWVNLLGVRSFVTR